MRVSTVKCCSVVLLAATTSAGRNVMRSVSSNSELNFLVMGDWGGHGEKVPNKNEDNTAKLMGEVAQNTAIENIFGLGDNFYPLGIPTDVTDERFNVTFEQEFDADSLQSMDFFILAGNHDYYGNITAEIDYTYHSPSNRWHFPTEYYTRIVQDSAQTFEIEFVMIDTPLLCGYDDDSVDEPELDNKGRMLMGGRPWTLHDEKVAQSQWNWIEEQLSNSKADYLIVMGHYPVWSVAEHGPTACLTSQLLPMLQQYEVTAYINGHDHTFEYIESEDDQQAGTIHQAFITSGGNSFCDRSSKNADSVPKEYQLKFHGCEIGGLTWIQANQTSLEFRIMIGTTTDVDYTSSIFSPRSKSLGKPQP